MALTYNYRRDRCHVAEQHRHGMNATPARPFRLFQAA
jgi:hypothetical protein